MINISLIQQARHSVEHEIWNEKIDHEYATKTLCNNYIIDFNILLSDKT